MNAAAKSETILPPEAAASIRFKPQPQHVGLMEILPDCQIALTKKPSRFHILMTRLVLGWKWTDLARGSRNG